MTVRIGEIVIDCGNPRVAVATRSDVDLPRGSWVVLADPDGNEFCVMSTVLAPEPHPFHHL